MHISAKISFLIMLFSFSGCSMWQEQMQNVDKVSHNVKTAAQDTKGDINTAVDSGVDAFLRTKADMTTSSFGRFVFGKETILRQLRHYPQWDGDEGYIENKKPIASLYEQFLQENVKRFMDEFQQHNPIPKYDQYKTDRENLQDLYQYKQKLKDAKYRLKQMMSELQVEALSQALDAVYGKVNLENFAYDASSEQLHLLLRGSKRGFAQNIYFDISPDEARTLEKKQNRLKTKLYFNVDEKMQLQPKLAVVSHDKKQYIAEPSQKALKRDRLILHAKNKPLDLSEYKADYTRILQNIDPPEWFERYRADKKVGYGIGRSRKEAKDMALQELAQSQEVIVSSKAEYKKQQQNGQITQQGKSSVQTQSQKVVLENVRVEKTEKNDGIWFAKVIHE